MDLTGYHDSFLRLVKQIEECGTTLSDREKRAHFTGGIKDRDYAVSKRCRASVTTFNETVSLGLAEKPPSLGKMNGPTRRQAKLIK